MTYNPNRKLYAVAALQALLSAHPTAKPDSVARRAFDFADAMVEEEERREATCKVADSVKGAIAAMSTQGGES